MRACSCTSSGPAAIRPDGVSVNARSRAAPASIRSSTATVVWRRSEVAAPCTIDPDSCPVTAPVTRSCSSWASSTTTAEYAGSTASPSKALMASIAWLVTTTSASAASARARSEKHSSAWGQRDAPRQSTAETETCRHARSVTGTSRSSRSPVSVWSAHARRYMTSLPNREEGPAAPSVAEPITPPSSATVKRASSPSSPG